MDGRPPRRPDALGNPYEQIYPPEYFERADARPGVTKPSRTANEAKPAVPVEIRRHLSHVKSNIAHRKGGVAAGRFDTQVIQQQRLVESDQLRRRNSANANLSPQFSKPSASFKDKGSNTRPTEYRIGSEQGPRGEFVGVLDYIEAIESGIVVPIYDEQGRVKQGQFLNKDMIKRPGAENSKFQMKMNGKVTKNNNLSADFSRSGPLRHGTLGTNDVDTGTEVIVSVQRNGEVNPVLEVPDSFQNDATIM